MANSPDLKRACLFFLEEIVDRKAVSEAHQEARGNEISPWGLARIWARRGDPCKTGARILIMENEPDWGEAVQLLVKAYKRRISYDERLIEDFSVLFAPAATDENGSPLSFPLGSKEARMYSCRMRERIKDAESSLGVLEDLINAKPLELCVL